MRNTLSNMRPILALFALLLSLLAAGVNAQPLPSLAPMLESVTPGVVNISTTAKLSGNSPFRGDPFFRRFFERDQRRGSEPQSLGSGVIVDADKGIVVTNDHVIDGADAIMVTLADGREFDAELLGADPDADIAVLKIDAQKLSALEWADSDQLRVGDFCVAIGNPFGLGQTVTSGIVSALGRSGLGIEEFEDFIQTDASINPGNSGGALVALDGRLIGINTAIVAPGGGNVGIGFAIPANLAKSLVEQIVETGSVQRGALGVSAQALTPQLAEAFDIAADDGVLIGSVQAGSPADNAGLRVGDVITAIDGRPVSNVREVRNRIGLVRIGQRLRLEVLRDGELRQVDAVVDKLQRASKVFDGAELSDERTGNGRRYVAINKIEPGSVLARSGLASGDFILSANRTPVSTVEELERVVDSARDGVSLLVQRGRETRYVLLDE